MNTTGERQSNFFDICIDCKSSCCRDARPPITSERRKIIETYLKEKKILIENPFVQAAYTFPREDAQGYCAFHDKKTSKCQIHPVKPETCVAGPITFDINPETRKIEFFLKMEKICPLAGKMFKNPPVLNKHIESAKKEIRRLILRLSPEALEAILQIGEPDTFKVDEDSI